MYFYYILSLYLYLACSEIHAFKFEKLEGFNDIKSKKFELTINLQEHFEAHYNLQTYLNFLRNHSGNNTEQSTFISATLYKMKMYQQEMSELDAYLSTSSKVVPSKMKRGLDDVIQAGINLIAIRYSYCLVRTTKRKYEKS